MIAQQESELHTVSGYETLESVLRRAYLQAAVGKGAERHANSLPFDQQPMLAISRMIGSKDGLIYQAIKKAQESQRMGRDAAVRELLGAINYLAGAIILLEEQPEGMQLMPMAANDNTPRA